MKSKKWILILVVCLAAAAAIWYGLQGRGKVTAAGPAQTAGEASTDEAGASLTEDPDRADRDRTDQAPEEEGEETFTPMEVGDGEEAEVELQEGESYEVH